MKYRLDPLSPNGLSPVSDGVTIVKQASGAVHTGAKFLNDLGDVDVSSGASDNQALAFDTATNKWMPQTIGGGSGSGDVVGPDSATDNAIGRYDGTTGKVIQNSGITIGDTDEMSGVDAIQFNVINTVTNAEGKAYWDNDAGTLALGLKGGNSILQTGQELVARAQNTSGATITNGSVVRVVGSTGDFPQIALADASDESTAHVLGVATNTITNNQFGYVTIIGMVNDIDTSAFTAGDEIWLSTTAGEFTNVQPNAPDMSVHVGFVIRSSATVGRIGVRPHLYPKLEQLSDVDGTDPTTTGDLLSFNAVDSTWERGAYNINDYQLILAEGAFADGDKTKLDGIEAGADVNNISDVNATDLTDGGDSTLHYHATDRARANHTGTQTASTISDFDTEVSNNTDVAANTAARHTHLNSTVLNNTTASFTTADETKLDGIEALADVTDATNVAAAGAVMESDISTASMSFVVDEDDMTSDLATKLPTQQSVKAYVDDTLYDRAVNLLDFIPKSEHAAIIARTSTYDCSSALTTALAASKSLRVPNGRYCFASTIALPGTIKIVGDGPSVQLAPQFRLINGLLELFTGGPGFTSESGYFENIFFDSSTPGTGKAFYANAAYISQMTFRNCTFSSNLAYGFDAPIVLCRFYDCDFGSYPGTYQNFTAIRSVGISGTYEPNANSFFGCVFRKSTASYLLNISGGAVQWNFYACDFEKNQNTGGTTIRYDGGGSINFYGGYVEDNTATYFLRVYGNTETAFTPSVNFDGIHFNEPAATAILKREIAYPFLRMSGCYGTLNCSIIQNEGGVLNSVSDVEEFFGNHFNAGTGSFGSLAVVGTSTGYTNRRLRTVKIMADEINAFVRANVSVTAATSIASLINPMGGVIYSGRLLVTAIAGNNAYPTGAANTATYDLLVSSGGLTTIQEVSKTGVTSGGAANHPSFTWTIVSGNLTATPISSTSGTFSFIVSSFGSVRAVAI